MPFLQERNEISHTTRKDSSMPEKEKSGKASCRIRKEGKEQELKVL